MFLRRTRFGALALMLVALFATPSAGSWFGEWFRRAGSEELPTPQAEPPIASPAPMLVPPSQSPSALEAWEGDAELVYPDAAEMHLPPGAGAVPDVDPWGDGSDVWEDGGSSGYPPSVDLPSLPESEHACCDPPTIRYWNHPLLAIVMGNSDCDEQQTAILQLEGDCCPIEVPVTIPACCVEAPQCDTRHGLLGRSTHEYEWPCGYRVKIVRWGNGPIVVHTYNSWGESCIGRRLWL